MFSMNDIEIYNETAEVIPYMDTIKEIVGKALEKEELENGNHDSHASCSIIIVDNDYIHTLNKKYRNIDKETDVISFALEDDKTCINTGSIRLLGDIYISIDRAREQALEYGHSLKRELCFLAVHGIYHLLGYDHRNKEEEETMFKKQEEVLLEYGITR